MGGSVGATWSHRNLFGNAEQLNLSAGVTGAGGRATKGLGYNVTSQFIKPEFRGRDQSLELNLGAIKQKLDAYDQDAVTAGAAINRKFSEVWSGSVGVSAEKRASGSLSPVRSPDSATPPFIPRSAAMLVRPVPYSAAP